jgi:5-methylcytosine-specific restriction endonuclease McrA
MHDIEYTLESYRIGERYWDVYSSQLISKPEIDHITPIVDAGGNEWPNMAVTSRRNNAAKGGLPLLQYLLARREGSVSGWR